MKKIVSIFAFAICANFAFASADVSALAENPAVVAESAEKTIPEKIVGWYADNLNYGTIALLMAVESSFIPFPSEVVIPPATYAACDPENEALHVSGSNFVNVALVVLAGTFGALVGALINYFLALFLGRPIVDWFADSRFGHACMIDGEKVVRAERFFVKYGIASTFFGRLVPCVRQLISVPAGLSQMRLVPFIIFTSLGAGLWNCVLALLGYFAHGKQEIINEYARELSWAILGGVAIFAAVLAVKFFSAKKK